MTLDNMKLTLVKANSLKKRKTRLRPQSRGVEADHEARKVTVRAYEKKVPVRKPLLEKLRREYEELFPEGYEDHEDEWAIYEETEKSEYLEFTPLDIWVRVTIRYKAKHNPTDKIRTAPIPVWPIARSCATSSLLAELTCGKYFYHIPFYRQRKIFSQLGFETPLSTIGSWFHEVADLKRPIYYEIVKMILFEDYVESDETTIPIVKQKRLLEEKPKRETEEARKNDEEPPALAPENPNAVPFTDSKGREHKGVLNVDTT